MSPEYDAILIVGFGGPEQTDQVIPFLENVTRGRNVPRERLLAVAEHYYHFGGKSPINDQVRELIAALRPALAERDIKLPIACGNRNWHPFLAEAQETCTGSGDSGTTCTSVEPFLKVYAACRAGTQSGDNNGGP